MASEGDKKDRITLSLRSSDSKVIKVEEAVAMESRTIRRAIENGCGDDKGFALPFVSSKILSKVIDYCEKHAGGGEDLNNWDAEFVKVDQVTLVDLIVAANYLDIKGLMDLTLKTVSDMIKGKTPEEISKIFNIKIGFTEEEEEEALE